jgi:hypothetical protein
MLAAVRLCLAFAVSTVAQVQTRTSTTTLQATEEVKVESGEVVAVEGNDLFAVVVLTVVRSSFMPGWSSWIPSCLPPTLTLAFSGTLGKWRRVPSDILTRNRTAAIATPIHEPFVLPVSWKE